MTDSSPPAAAGRDCVLAEGVDRALAELRVIAKEFPPSDVPGSRVFHRVTNRLCGPVPELLEVSNVTIPRRLGGIGLRVYRPREGTLPAVLFVHGGWFVSGDLESHDTLCRALAETAGCVVIALHYRRAPEHPCPAAPDDCFETAQWIVEHAEDLGIDAGALAIVGDSTGGTLAAVTTQRARRVGGPTFCRQVLLYPVISREQDTETWREMAAAPLVSAEKAKKAWARYVPTGASAAPEDISPDAMADLSGLPPALVVTAECDPLRAEGEGYADALQRAGVPTVVRRYPGMVHGFAEFAGVVPAARELIGEIAGYLRSVPGWD